MNLIDKIKLLFSIRQPVTDLVGEVKQAKSGWNTLPFWLSVLTTLGTLAAALTGYLAAPTALIITTSITVLYNILRAIQNAGQPGIQPLMLSTRFWTGILGILAAGITSLQAGGVNPTWLVTASGVIAAVMSGAQSIGAVQPADTTPPATGK